MHGMRCGLQSELSFSAAYGEVAVLKNSREMVRSPIFRPRRALVGALLKEQMNVFSFVAHKWDVSHDFV